jgi:uncharacterized protein
MSEAIFATYHRLIDELEVPTYRYLYDSFDLSARLTGLIGPRGVGKTTLLLQYIKNRVERINDAFYFSADHIFFNKVSLFDFVRDLYEAEGVSLVFIDEIHKYRNWSQELKNLYDAFPRIKIVFSGSSSIDLVGGTHDLSRRGVLYYLRGLSFREYLNFKTSENHPSMDLASLLESPIKTASNFSQISRLRAQFKHYLEDGYYPFVFEQSGHYYQQLTNVIDKTIFEDIANHYDLKTANLHYFKQILYFLSTIPPGEISTHNLSRNLRVDDKTALHYIRILQSTGLVRLLHSPQRGSRLLRNPAKAYLDNTSLLHAICSDLGQEVDRGTVRELFFLSALQDAGESVFYDKKAGDFQVGDTVFEIGGKNKKTTQIRQVEERAFVVKDDILTGGKRTLPLHLFGFLY